MKFHFYLLLWSPPSKLFTYLSFPLPITYNPNKLFPYQTGDRNKTTAFTCYTYNLLSKTVRFDPAFLLVSIPVRQQRNYPLDSDRGEH